MRLAAAVFAVVAVVALVASTACGADSPRNALDVPPDAECVVSDIDVGIEVAVWRCLAADDNVADNERHVVAYQAGNAFGVRGVVRIERSACDELTALEQGPAFRGGPACP